MLKKLNMKESKVFDVDSTHVLYEIFHSIIREVRDEVCEYANESVVINCCFVLISVAS